MKIPMKLVYQYIAIFNIFPLTSNHLHSLQVENCDSNSRLVVDEDDNVKSGFKGLKHLFETIFLSLLYLKHCYLVYQVNLIDYHILETK